jgi:hypothetical protein
MVAALTLFRCDVFEEGWEEPGAGGALGSSQLGERLQVSVRFMPRTGTGVPCPYKSAPQVHRNGVSRVGFGGDGSGGGAYG